LVDEYEFGDVYGVRGLRGGTGVGFEIAGLGDREDDKCFWREMEKFRWCGTVML
jgi:hypothetical protein